MAKKKILTIGLSLADEEIKFSDFNSNISLLDWDIILFKPNINSYINKRESMFEGKPCLSDNESFKLKAQSEHWRREIKTAVEHGKLVVIFMDEFTPVSIATGQKEFSGTGKNQKVTRIVANYDNYRCIPLDFKLINTKGKEITLTSKNSELLSTYWNEFAGVSSYKVIIEGTETPCLVTKHGEKVVGTIIRSKNSSGALICLPDVDFYQDIFFSDDEDEDNDGWSPEGKQFAARFIKEIVSLDKFLHSSGELTPEPEWAKDSRYKLDQENKAYEKLLVIEEKLEKIQIEKETIVDEIKGVGRLRNLLFEKGKPLENAILEALKVLGFEVSQFNNGESEFDAVFESKEGRLIGEVEGKDNKAINIDKLRQLALNIHEDLEREEIDKPAKAVLFGNSYRLLPINERTEPFTTKCISAASTSSTALVFCPDLFMVTKYLKDKRDSSFATKCRKAILNSVGRVNFPEIPNGNKESS